MARQRKGIQWFSNLQLILYTTILFVVLLLFIDRDSYFTGQKLKAKIHDLEQQRDFLIRQIREDSLVVRGIETDDAFLEKYARENYYMLRRGEAVFVIDSIGK